jgi:hypothetical protein
LPKPLSTTESVDYSPWNSGIGRSEVLSQNEPVGNSVIAEYLNIGFNTSTGGSVEFNVVA